MGIFKKKQQHKFCPVCGNQLHANDDYCTRCGYSFAARHKRMKKGIKWRNLLIALALLVFAYFTFRYFGNQSIIPTSVADALNFSLTNAPKIP